MQENLPNNNVQPGHGEEIQVVRQRRYRSARAALVNNTNEIQRESDENKRHTIIKPPRERPYALRPPAQGKFELPDWMTADEQQADYYLSPVVIQLILSAVIALGFVFVFNTDNSFYYILFSVIAVICVVWFVKLNRLMLLQLLAVFLGFILIVFSVSTAADIANTNRAVRAEQEAALAASILIQNEARAAQALKTPSPEEIARGGKTHDGIPLKMVLYYQGTSRYHTNLNCGYVNEAYRPLQNFLLYEQLTERKFANMQPCNVCKAPVRPHSH